MTDDEAVDEHLAAQDDAWDEGPLGWGFAAYVATIVILAVLAIHFGVWVLLIGGSLAVLGYAWAFGTRRRGGTR